MTAETSETSRLTSADARQATGILVTVMATVAFAANNVLIPLAYGHGVTPTALLLLRYIILVAGLLIILPLAGQSLWLPRRYYVPAIATGCFSCLDSLGLITAFGLIPVGLSLLIFYLYPILTAILQGLIERRPVSLVQFGCLVSAFAGLAIALGAGGEGFAHGLNLIGLLSALGAAVASAAMLLCLRYGLADAEPGAMTLSTSLASMALAAIAGAALSAAGLAPFHIPGLGNSIGWLTIVALSVFFSFGYFGISRGAQLLGATPTAMLMNLETVFSIPLAAIILGEALDTPRLTGAAIVLASVVVSQWLAARRTLQTHPPQDVRPRIS